MKYLDEYRDPGAARRLADAIAGTVTRQWTLMEMCGGQTHAIVKFGLDQMLPGGVTLIHGPGCPVCVTPIELIDKSIQIARRPGTALCSFGDMLRVPGSGGDLLSAKARGGNVRVVYSPLDALRYAEQNPGLEVVFFAVGFETTAPATAMAVWQAARRNVTNFSLLVSHVLVPPAVQTILRAKDCRVRGFLAAGHVCAVAGFAEYEPLAARYRVPIVVTGFEPLDILQGVLMVVRQLEEGRAEVENQYGRAVRREGNVPAQKTVAEVFETVDRSWRGVGRIPSSGLGLRQSYACFDAERKLGLQELRVPEPEDCLSGQVLQGRIRPAECPAFGQRCTPEHPLGATMVSSEGACAAYYKYRRMANAAAS
jgi:hydrogenase expression/formation protein HypD